MDFQISKKIEFRSKIDSVPTGSPLKSGIFGRRREFRRYTPINSGFLIMNLLELDQNLKSVFCNLASKSSIFATEYKQNFPWERTTLTKVRLRRENYYHNYQENYVFFERFRK